jgi:hypothetical protein
MKMNLSRRVGAEFIGTFWLVFVGCGSAVLAVAFPDLGSVSPGGPGLRAYAAHDGVRDRPYLGMLRCGRTIAAMGPICNQ